MKNNAVPVILGFLSSGLTQFFWQNILVAMSMAFVGAIIGWCTKETLDAIKRKIKNRKNATR